jgi:anti-anti-sigma regulatory factor
MDQSLGSNGSPGACTIVVTAECEVCLESVERHRRALRAALEGAPRVLCVDFSGTRLFGSDAVRFLCAAAVCCDYLGVELRVLDSPAVKRTLDLVGLPGYNDWLAHGYLQATHRPMRMSAFAFGCALPAMTATQLESARSACSAPHHAADGSTRRRVSRSRERAIMRVQRRSGQPLGATTASAAVRAAGMLPADGTNPGEPLLDYPALSAGGSVETLGLESVHE